MLLSTAELSKKFPGGIILGEMRKGLRLVPVNYFPRETGVIMMSLRVLGNAQTVKAALGIVQLEAKKYHRRFLPADHLSK